MAASFGGSIWQPFELRFDSPESYVPQFASSPGLKIPCK